MNKDLSELSALRIPVLDVKVVEGLQDLDFIQVTVPGGDAVASWRVLRDAVPVLERWPVMIGGPDCIEQLQSLIEFKRGLPMTDGNESASLRQQVASWLAAAEKVSFDQWLWNHRDPAWLAADFDKRADKIAKFSNTEQLVQFYRSAAESYRSREPEVFDPSQCEWPQQETATRTKFSVLDDYDFYLREDAPAEYTGPRLYERIVILLLPTTKGWEAPAYLFFGGFNDCPPPEVHVAMAKWGFQRYGAEVAVIHERGFIEMECHRPPANRADALTLARDLKTYAEQVSVDAKTLGVLASALKSGSVWHLWWD